MVDLSSCATHLNHVSKVVEVLAVVNGQLVVTVHDPVVDDITGDTDTQNVVARVTDRLPNQEEAVLHRAKFGHGLRA